MHLAKKFISNDKTVRSDTVQNLKDFNSKSLATQAKKRTIIFYDACSEKRFGSYG